MSYIVILMSFTEMYPSIGYATPNHRFSRLDATAAFQAATSANSNWVQQNFSQT
jgi:hypothetical protein